MFAFGGESRFLVYPVIYKGSFGDSQGTRAKFNDFFKNDAIEIDVISGLREIEACPEIVSTLLCRDFCLTVRDEESGGDSFVILAGSSPADCYEFEDKPPKSFMINSAKEWRFIENDSHTAFPNLDHVTFFLISLKTMKVVDFLHFKYDFIYLAHHLGVGLDGNKFSILSMKNQRIFLFEIDKDARKFSQLGEIARNSHEPELKKQILKTGRDDSWGRSMICGLMLKMIKYIIDQMGLKDLPCPYSILMSLHIWKHQLLPNDKILMRLVPANLILATNPRHQSMVHALDPLPSIHKNSYLIVYDAKNKRIDSIFNSAETGLLEWMKENWRALRGRTGDLDGFETAFLAIKRGSESGGDETLTNSIMRRLTNTLPQSPQQLTESPYLDTYNFRWDPKISAILSKQTPISCNYFMNCEPITGATGLYETNYGPGRVKFFSRARSNLLSYSLRFVDENMTAGGATEATGMDRHKWVNVLFHPTMPLIVVYQYGIFRSLSVRIFYN